MAFGVFQCPLLYLSRTFEFYFFKICLQRKAEMQRKGISCWLRGNSSLQRCTSLIAELCVAPSLPVDSSTGYHGFDKKLDLEEIR